MTGNDVNDDEDLTEFENVCLYDILLLSIFKW